MDKRLTEWLTSLSGLATALVTAIAAPGLIYAAVSNQLAPIGEFLQQVLGLTDAKAQLAAQLIAFLLLLLIAWFVIRSYRRFARSSRLEQPDRFTLVATTPESLIGRAEDLAKLQDSLVKNRVVLLDGESGCGKSALVAAGVVPRLKTDQGLLPVLVRDWGDDWVRGPLASALGALHDVLTPEQRATLGWTQLPDLAADATMLVAELDRRLLDVAGKLGRRPLLIADQFDDYQAAHREKFLDAEGNWLKPEALAAANPFWSLVRARLLDSGLHLLAVTRADTASGLSCLRFLDTAMTVDRQIPRVEVEYLRQLLHGIAPDDANPPVVSHPEQGWHALRDRLEADLRMQGAILMQQVRTVLLGLRQLPLLTVSAYRRAGELRGVESLVIARAIRRAGDAAGGGETGQAVARRLLGALVLPGGANQLPKAQRRTLRELNDLAGGDAEKILRALQADDVVRPAEGAGGAAWQLDHDYLARAVLAEARQADRWGEALREGLERFRHAAGSWRQRWSGLLPMTLQVRLAWERMRGRIRYGEAANYALVSLVKPALVLVLAGAASAGAHFWNQDQQLTAQARAIYDRFGSSNEAAAVLDAWSAPEAVRRRLYTLVHEDDGRLQRACRSLWPRAHGGLEADRLLEAARTLRTCLEQERDFLIAGSLARSYAAMAAGLAEQKDIKAEAQALRVRLLEERDYSIAQSLASSYVAVVPKLADQEDIRAEAEALRARLLQERDHSIAQSLASSYVAVVPRLADQKDIRAEAEALRARLVQERDVSILELLASGYVAVVPRLADQKDIRAEAEALRVRLLEERDHRIVQSLASGYVAVVPKLADQKDIRAEAKALRARLVQERDVSIARALANGYVVVAAELAEQKDIKAEARALRIRLLQERDGTGSLLSSDTPLSAELAAQKGINAEIWTLHVSFMYKHDYLLPRSLARSYVATATKLAEQKDIKAEADELRVRLLQERDRWIAEALASSYAEVAARLAEQKDIEVAAGILRVRLLEERDHSIARALADRYVAVTAKLADQKGLKTEAEALRGHLLKERDRRIVQLLARSYAAVAAKLAAQNDIEIATGTLRARLTQEPHDVIGDSFLSVASSYAAVVAMLTEQRGIKAEAEALRGHLLRERNHLIAQSLASGYVAVVSKLADQKDIRAEAEALRGRLLQERDHSIAQSLASGYVAVVPKLADQKDIWAEAEALRGRLEKERGWIVQSLARSYAAVATKLAEQKDIKAAADVLRARLLQERDSSIAKSLASSYAAVARRQAQLPGDAAVREAVASEILTMAGHPLVQDTADLLAALEPIAGRSFASDTGAAIAWWVKEFNGNPATLRPHR